ncbi:MAG: type II toxin-antitoxin system RelB/DinJ family antitoxin [Coriobacteriales bacterium]|nr:type II toxin-antitoxin system RelB/DinJ family antitoxin [Coriobacteriales bacterium]
MATVIVSGRIEETVKQKAAQYIEALGLTAADVIKNVWNTIALTGEVPLSPEQNTMQVKQAKLLDEFESFTDSLPQCSQEFVNMSEEDMRKLLVDRYV